MKKSILLTGIAALALLFSCNKSELVDDGPKVTEDMTVAYATVRISMANSTGTRATFDGFEYGTEAENAVSSLLLVFYDANGNVVGQSIDDPFSWTEDATHNPGNDNNVNVADKYTKTVAISLIEGASLPSSVVAYINPTAQDIKDFVTDLASAKELTRPAKTTGTVPGYVPATIEAGAFAMNNSCYGDYSIATAIPQGAIYKKGGTPGEPIDIYVERVVAKIELAAPANGNGVTINDYTVYDGLTSEKMTLTYELEGWASQAKSQNTNVLKKMPATTVDWMNPANLYRTYWAASYGYDMNNAQFPVTGADNFNAEDYLLEYVAYEGTNDGTYAENKFEGVSYVLENTYENSRLVVLNGENEPTQQEGTNPWAAVTSIILKGSYTASANADAAGFYLRNGYIYDPAEEKQVPAYYYYAKKNEAELIQTMISGIHSFATAADGTIDPTVLELVYVPMRPTILGDEVESAANLRFVQIKEDADVTIYIPNPDFGKEGAETAEQQWIEATEYDADADLQKFGGFVKYYDANKAFFYVPLQHYYTGTLTSQYLPLDEIQTGTYGVVRNHLYRLTVNSISGLGIGIGDPTDIPLPDPQEDQEFEIQAKLNVLEWHVVGQIVDL